MEIKPDWLSDFPVQIYWNRLSLSQHIASLLRKRRYFLPTGAIVKWTHVECVVLLINNNAKHIDSVDNDLDVENFRIVKKKVGGSYRKRTLSIRTNLSLTT